MFDPFKIVGPTCVNVSGGRTSAYLLKRVIESNGGIPDDTHLIFCNTGKEDEATLKFVNDISLNWGVPITWLEYRYSPQATPTRALLRAMAHSIEPALTEVVSMGQQFEVVTYETASRNGEPFEAIIRQRGGVLPNPRSRYCSSEMKTRTIHRYLRSLGIQDWETMLGIRADEPRRVAKFRFNPHPETQDEFVRIPLADAFVTAGAVGEFWRAQSFDLALPNNGGKTIHGNCDLCFLKTGASLVSLIAEKPERGVWWAKQEKQAEAVAHGDGCRFRIDRPGYGSMYDFARSQADMYGFDGDEEAISCFCGD